MHKLSIIIQCIVIFFISSTAYSFSSSSYLIANSAMSFFDYEEAKECALELDKPLFLDFTGHACFNCRRMEENVWIHPDVKKILNEDYIIVALYVDDKTRLINDEQYKTLGDKNFALQMDEFCSNAQPFYVLLDPSDKTVLATPVAYDTNIQNFVDFLNEGKKEFYKK